MEKVRIASLRPSQGGQGTSILVVIRDGPCKGSRAHLRSLGGCNGGCRGDVRLCLLSLTPTTLWCDEFPPFRSRVSFREFLARASTKTLLLMSDEFVCSAYPDISLVDAGLRCAGPDALPQSAIVGMQQRPRCESMPALQLIRARAPPSAGAGAGSAIINSRQPPHS